MMTMDQRARAGLEPDRVVSLAVTQPSTHSLRGLDGIDLLMADVRDGVAAGIFGVISVLIASDLMRGTGRFNLAQGLTALSVGIGAALTNATAGYVVQGFGYPAGFLYLAGTASVALVFFAVLMPETKSAEPA